jgi:hypothetical protein
VSRCVFLNAHPKLCLANLARRPRHAAIVNQPHMPLSCLEQPASATLSQPAPAAAGFIQLYQVSQPQPAVTS